MLRLTFQQLKISEMHHREKKNRAKRNNYDDIFPVLVCTPKQ